MHKRKPERYKGNSWEAGVGKMRVTIQLSRRERLSEEQLRPFHTGNYQLRISLPARSTLRLPGPYSLAPHTPQVKASNARGSRPTTRINLHRAGQWAVWHNPGKRQRKRTGWRALGAPPPTPRRLMPSSAGSRGRHGGTPPTCPRY